MVFVVLLLSLLALGAEAKTFPRSSEELRCRLCRWWQTDDPYVREYMESELGAEFSDCSSEQEEFMNCPNGRCMTIDATVHVSTPDSSNATMEFIIGDCMSEDMIKSQPEVLALGCRDVKHFIEGFGNPPMGEAVVTDVTGQYCVCEEYFC